MKLPPGTPSGKTFRLRGKGVSTLGGYGKGDQLVHVVVDIPEKLNAKQRASIQELGRLLDEGASQTKRGIVGKIRSILE
jgi:molecular chaperone DnaJ